MLDHSLKGLWLWALVSRVTMIERKRLQDRKTARLHDFGLYALRSPLYAYQSPVSSRQSPVNKCRALGMRFAARGLRRTASLRSTLRYQALDARLQVGKCQSSLSPSIRADFRRSLPHRFIFLSLRLLVSSSP